MNKHYKELFEKLREEKETAVDSNRDSRVLIVDGL